MDCLYVSLVLSLVMPLQLTSVFCRARLWGLRWQYVCILDASTFASCGVQTCCLMSPSFFPVPPLRGRCVELLEAVDQQCHADIFRKLRNALHRHLALLCSAISCKSPHIAMGGTATLTPQARAAFGRAGHARKVACILDAHDIHLVDDVMSVMTHQLCAEFGLPSGDSAT